MRLKITDVQLRQLRKVQDIGTHEQAWDPRGELQFGGTSGDEFLDFDQLREGYRQLANTGRFENGVFRATGAQPNQDGYEAVCQTVTGRSLEYTPPRYADPIMMQPDHFYWYALDGSSGVYHKPIDRFTERATCLCFYAIEPDATLHLSPQAATRLGFVLTGHGSLCHEDIETETAFRLDSGEEANLQAVSEMEIIVIDLPSIPQPVHQCRPS